MGEVDCCVRNTFGHAEVLSPMHLLWVNLVTDGPPATAWALPSPIPVPSRPRHRDEAIMTRWMLIRCVALDCLYLPLFAVFIPPDYLTSLPPSHYPSNSPSPILLLPGFFRG